MDFKGLPTGANLVLIQHCIGVFLHRYKVCNHKQIIRYKLMLVIPGTCLDVNKLCDCYPFQVSITQFKQLLH